jgi:tetratricopeptide (TPR) repeat protein
MKSDTDNAGIELPESVARRADPVSRQTRTRVRRFLPGIVALLLTGCSWTTPAANLQDFSTHFDAANKLYEQGKYTEAAGQYQDLLRNRIASPALYYNLGNAFFKAGQIGQAIAAYRQAELLAPRDPDLQANLRFVRNQIQGPTLAPDRWLGWLGRLTLNEWTWLATTVFWLWLLLLIIGSWRSSLKPALRGYVYTLGTAAVGIWLCVATLAYTRHTEPGAVVISHDVIAHNGPLDESPSAFTLHDGAELEVLDEKDQWLQVNVGTARAGWIRRDQVEVLPRS